MFMKNIKKSISIFFSIIFILFAIDNYTFASINEKLNYYDFENNWWGYQTEAFKETYEIFLNKIINKEDFIAEDAYYVRFRENNDKLIIGSSAVVWCGNVMGDELDKYGFDIVGFGGMPDNKMKEWANRINKKYSKIIYFSGINTLDICSYNNMDTINNSVFESIVTTMINIVDNILDHDGHLSYVRIKDLQYDESVTPKERVEFCKRFNKMAKELNAAMDLVNVYKIDITYPMDAEHSAGYVHYNNKIVWEDLLKNAE